MKRKPKPARMPKPDYPPESKMRDHEYGRASFIQRTVTKQELQARRKFMADSYEIEYRLKFSRGW